MNSKSVKKMVAVSLLIAIVVILQLTSSMLPTLPGGAKLSFVLIPIVLGAALLGPGAGALLGAIFGCIAFYYSVSGADGVGFAIFTASPFGCFAICLSKSTLAGYLSGLIYKYLCKFNDYLAMLCASIVCPVVNTGIFMGMVVLFFEETMFSPDPTKPEVKITIISILGVIMLCNAIPELIINAVFSPAGQRIIKVVKKYY